MADEKKHGEPMIEKNMERIAEKNLPKEDIQHGKQQQRPDVNPPVQPGHRDREQV